MVDVTLVNGVYKPTSDYGAHIGTFLGWSIYGELIRFYQLKWENGS